mmetsp:Transcript_14161/g.18536  ORF Transcript_14161/g.18536 Transcript_14161/m.18536 type:complete len:139 (+) Transcript_14161:175-591(+)
MMKHLTTFSFLALLAVTAAFTTTTSTCNAKKRSVFVPLKAAVGPATAVVSHTNDIGIRGNENLLSNGAAEWLNTVSKDDDESVIGSSSFSVSLEERKPPTKEEIEAKKRNFNFWFWGGGFVAPFLATFYYFGLKFWRY